jgi:hypothetical protein
MPLQSRGTHRRPSSKRGTRVVAITVTGSLSAAGMVLAAGAAAADSHQPVSQAEGRFLEGAGSIDLDDIAALAAAQAENHVEADPVVDRNPLTPTVLNSTVLPIGPVNLVGENGLIDLGAVNQVAIARPNGSSLGASGAVTDDGAIDIGGSSAVPADATVNLDSLLPDTGVLDDLDLSIGALSARATQAAGAHGNQDSTYQIADLVLSLDSTVVSGLLAPLLGEQAEIDALTGLLNALGLGVVTTSALPDLQDLVNGVGTQTSPDGVLTVNLATGVITVDLEELINLNNLPPNTPLLPYVLDALTTQLVPTVQEGLDELTADITAALDGVTANADLLGIVTPVPEGVLDGLIATIVDGLSLDPAAVGAGVFDNAISNLLDGVLALTANVQDEPPNTVKSGIVDEFTVTALQINLLGSAAIVNLASASVGPNFGPAVAAPVGLSLDPDSGPVTGGTVVTITGTGLEPGSTVSVDGGPAITPDAINGNGTQLVFTTPPHAAGPVGVTVTNANGTTAPLTYTYIPVGGPADIAPPVITDPDNGDETDDTTPPITGAGTPGATVTVREGSTVLCTAVVRTNGTWTCTPAVALSLGSHTIRATQTLDGRTSGASAPVTFRIVDGDAGGAGNENDNGGLPNTGAGFDPLPFGVAGLALILAGLAMAATRGRETQV